jgi:hypothetical protein
MEMLHFRDADKILKKKKLLTDLTKTCGYLESVLDGARYKRNLFRLALDEMGWLPEKLEDLRFMDGRRYEYKGVKGEIAVEGSFSVYEYILEGIFRLQIGFDKGMIQAGVLMLTSLRGENSKYGTSTELAKTEVEMLYPTINLPVTIALLDIGKPMIIDDEGGGESNGISIPPDDQEGFDGDP